MYKRIYCLVLLLILTVNQLNAQEDVSNNKRTLSQQKLELMKHSYARRIQKQKEISEEAKQSLELKGFHVLGPAPKLIFPQKDSLAKEDEVMRIEVSFDLSKSGIKPVYIDASRKKSMFSSISIDTIMTEDFEGDFPGTKWQRTGDPTWGKTDYQRHNGSYSIWFAKDGTKGIQPGQGYPNNCNSMMIYGPFDLSDVNYGELRFWYWLDTEEEKDWLYCTASLDGVNFSGIGMSGQSGSWDEEVLFLSNMPILGNICGQSKVWIAFSFDSDNHSTADEGVYLDDILLTKRQVQGTPLAGAIFGSLSHSGNPYIALNDVGVAEGDSLVIDPGVEVRFDKGFAFFINGSMSAIGTPSDSIIFTSNITTPNYEERWGGLHFSLSEDDNCELKFCRISYAGLQVISTLSCGGGILCYDGNVNIKNCCISKNYGGMWNAGIICLGGYLTIENNLIENNLVGIVCIYTEPIIKGNTIRNNEGAISLKGGGANIQDNIIIQNGYGIDGGTSGIINNNKIYNNNSHGISIGGRGYYGGTGIWKITNNEIIGNYYNGLQIAADVPDVIITNNIIVKNVESGISINAGADNNMINIVNNTIFNNGINGVCLGAQYGYRINSLLSNNIISNNKVAGLLSLNTLSLQVLYNNVFGNGKNFDLFNMDSLGVLCKTNVNGDSCDTNFNLITDPLFMYPDTNNYNLRPSSPCINAGNPNSFFNDTDGSTNDMGAFGGDHLFTYEVSFDFGNFPLGSSQSHRFEIFNGRDTDFLVRSADISDKVNFSIATSFPMSIPPYGSGYIEVVFKPQSVGLFESELSISSNDFHGTSECIYYVKGKCINATIIEGGNVAGKWLRSNSPYYVKGNLVVQNGSQLIIDPGVDIIFENDSEIKVNGNLFAMGTMNDSIIFTHSNPNGFWGGIYLKDPENCNIAYCRIEYSSLSGIVCEKGTNITIRNSTIRNNKGHYWSYIRPIENGGGISCCESSPKIFSNSIINNVTGGSGGGICTWWGSSAEISNNIIIGNSATVNGGGVSSCGSDDAIILSNNIIMRNSANYGGGISSLGSSDSIRANIVIKNFANFNGGGVVILSTAVLINNVISWNKSYRGGGITLDEVLDIPPVVVNNTITNNIASLEGGGVYYNFHYFGQAAGTNYWIKNSIIYFNEAPQGRQIFGYKGKVVYTNIEEGYEGLGNIDNNPLFLDPANSDYHLQQNSSCIDAGCDSAQYNDIEEPNHPGYASYPALGTVRNDMGAYGGPGAANWIYTPNQPPTAFSLVAPANDDTVFTTNPVCSWQLATDPDPGDQVHYSLYYALDVSFTNAVTVSSIFTNSYAFHNLQDHRWYYWRIEAVDNKGASNVSNIFRFYTFAAPMPFTLISPSLGDTITTDTLVFKWHPAFGSDPKDTISYTFYCDTSRSFVNPIKFVGISDTTFTLTDSLLNNTWYFWKVMAIDKNNLVTSSSETFTFLVHYSTTDVDDRSKPGLPKEFALNQNYPNPFNPTTTIKYQLPKSETVSIVIYNVLGQNVRNLIYENQNAGYYTVNWDGKSDSGNDAASGVYIYCLRTKDFVKSLKMVLIR